MNKKEKKRDADPNNPIISKLIKHNPEAVIIVGFDDAMVGTARTCGEKPVAVYSTNLILERIMDITGLNPDDAWDHYYHEIELGLQGPNAPLLLNLEYD